MPWLVGHRSWWQCTEPCLTLLKLSKVLWHLLWFLQLIRDETGVQESQQKKAVSLESQEGIKDTTKHTQKTENMNLCRASCWGVALMKRLALPPPQSHCSSHPVPVPGKWWTCGDGGGQPMSPACVPSPRPQPVSPAPQGPLSRRQLVCRLLIPVPSAVARCPRSRGSGGEGWQQLGTGEPPTHTETVPPPGIRISAPCQPLGPPWQEGSAQHFCLKDGAFPPLLPWDNGCGPRKLVMNSWEAAVAAKIKYRLLLKNFFHL